MDGILLTKAQADAVKGKYGDYSALSPTPTKDGYWMLPIEVLKKKEFKTAIAKLKKCESAVIKETKVIDTQMSELDPMREKTEYTMESKEPLKEDWLLEEDKPKKVIAKIL